jgi:hypothetical protein
MAEHCAENNLDCNGQLLVQLTILIVSSATFWTSGNTGFETRATLCRQHFVKTIPGFFCLATKTNPFRLLDAEAAPSVQMAMRDFHDKG